MDVLYFLEGRTRFIRYYYETAATSFLDIQHKIENEEPPYNDPPWDDSGEPAFLDEFLTAEDGLMILGRSCLSLVSGSISLYFSAWEQELGIALDDAHRKHLFKKGVLPGYRAIFEHYLSNSWTESPADLAILEQVILARNTDQHAGHITSLQAYYSASDSKKHPNLFFVREEERDLDPSSAGSLFYGSNLTVTRDALFRAIDELEKLARWLEPLLLKLRWGR